MKTIVSLTILASLLVPSVLAGDSGSPEIVDAAGDAPGPLDVTSAWFTAVEDGKVELTIALADLTQPNPLADGNAADTRYVYQVHYTPSSWERRTWFECQIQLVETSAVLVNGLSHNSHGEGVGTSCFGENYQGATTVTPRAVVDTVAGTITITLTEGNVVDLSPGATLSDIEIVTSIGEITNTGFVTYRGRTVDTAGTGFFAI